MRAILTAIAEANLPIDVKNQLFEVLGIDSADQLTQVWESSGVEPLELLEDVLAIVEQRQANKE